MISAAPRLPQNLNKLIQTNSAEIERGLTKTDKPKTIISVPELVVSENRLKCFANGMDDSFKTRSSQLSDSYFKDMPRLIRVNAGNLNCHYVPGFTTSVNDSHSKPRTFDKITTNKVSLSDTSSIIAEKTDVKISALKVISAVAQKNKYNDVGMPKNKSEVGYSPIPEIHQDVEISKVNY